MIGLLSRILPFALAFFCSLCIMVLELVASRLVAQHVGGSLIVWTSVIGVILAGICLGNVFGGRLADRIEPSRAVGPLLAIGSFLVLGCLWMNAAIGLISGLDQLPWDLRTLVVVTLDFLLPATVLGMVSPVVAKMAVERSKRSGSAIGDVYMMGAIGSIAGTFLTGFYLIYLARISTIVTLVAAALALLAAAVMGNRAISLLAVVAAGFLAAGGFLSPVPTPANFGSSDLPGITIGSTTINVIALAGHVLALVLGVVALMRLLRSPAPELVEETFLPDEIPLEKRTEPSGKLPALRDLAALSFLISFAFMALEMVAGRLLTRHTGSSIYGWTSVIAVLLGGLSLGNYLGGKLANRITNRRQVSWLFMIGAILTGMILLTETPPNWLVSNPVGYFTGGADPEPFAGGPGEFLSQPVDSSNPITGDLPWGYRLLIWTAIVFFVPSVLLGTVSPVVVKLAVDRLRGANRTGTAIGSVYAWGMVGSLLGTFVVGFYLIDLLGTKTTLLVLAGLLAIPAGVMGSLFTASLAGAVVGFSLIPMLPVARLQERAPTWGLSEPKGDPSTTEDGDIAYVDESRYYFIKVTNYDDEGKQNRTLVLDNLIHGYFILDHPEQLDYDYEHIYALVTDRVTKSRAQTSDPTAPPKTPLSALFLGGGSYTFPRYLQSQYPGVVSDVAEIDPAVTKANHIALALPNPVPGGIAAGDPRGIRTVWGDARQFVVNNQGSAKKYDVVYGDAFNDFSVPWHLTTKQFNDMVSNLLTDDGVLMANIIDIYESDENAREASQEGAEGYPADPEESVREARKKGGFLGSWVETAKLTFPYVYIFGTEEPGLGGRETFVVVAAKKPVDVAELGTRAADPQFYDEPKLFAPFGSEDMEAVRVRSQGIILTDDYGPVENLLAPVAATRGE